MMAIIGLVSCSNGKKATGNGSAADSTATENKADSANVGAGSAAEMGEDDEYIKDDPTNV